MNTERQRNFIYYRINVTMKKLLALLTLTPYLSFAQEGLMFSIFPLQEGKVTYTKIIEAPGLDKGRIFTMVKDWAVDAYKSQKVAVQSEDKEGGYLAYKGFSKVVGKYSVGLLKGQPYALDVWHTLKFYIKEEKLKVVMSDLQVQSHLYYKGQDFGSTNDLEKMEEELDKRIEKKTINLKKANNIKEGNQYTYQVIDAQIKLLISSVESRLLGKKKSEFDF